MAKRMGAGEVLARARHALRINRRTGIPVQVFREHCRKNGHVPGELLDRLLRYGDVVVEERRGRRWLRLDEL